MVGRYKYGLKWLDYCDAMLSVGDYQSIPRSILKNKYNMIDVNCIHC